MLRTYNRALRYQTSASRSSSSGAKSAGNWNATAMTISYEDMIKAEKEALLLLNW